MERLGLSRGMRGRQSRSAIWLLAVMAFLLTLGTGFASSAGASSNSHRLSRSAGVAQAQAIVNKKLERPTSIGIHVSLKGKPVKNKTIDFLQCGVPACQAYFSYVKAAAATVGWTVTSINIGETPQTAQAGFSQALQQHPGAIIVTGGAPRSYFTTELEQAKQDRILVGYVSDLGTAGGAITTIQLGTQYNLIIGALMADWITAKTKGHADALFVNVPEIPSIGVELSGFNAELKRVCPGCSSTPVNVPVAQIGTPTAAATIAQTLRTKPSVNYIALGFGDLYIGLPSAIQSAGVKTVPAIAGSDNSTADLQGLASGGLLKAEIGLPAEEVFWRFQDAFLRHLNNQPVAPSDNDATYPLWILTKSNLPTDTTVGFPFVKNFEAQYKKLWNVG